MSSIQSLLFHIFVFLISISIYNVYLKKQDKRFKWAVILLLSVVYGFRYGFGTDYGNYINLITELNVRPTEPINLLLYLPGYIFRNVQITFVLYQATTLFFIIQAIDLFFENKNNKLFALSYYLFCMYPNSFNTIREGLSVTILLCSLVYLFKNKDIRSSLLLYFLSLLVHNGAIVLLPIYICVALKNKLDWRITLFYFVFVILMFVIVMNKVNIPFPGRLQHYINNTNVELGIGIIVMHIPLFIYLLALNKVLSHQIIKSLSIIVIISVVLRHLAYINFYFYRFYTIAMIANVLLVGLMPTLFAKVQSNNQVIKVAISTKTLFILFIVYNVLFFVYLYYLGDTGEIMSYNFRFIV